jgi:hypothetical protein
MTQSFGLLRPLLGMMAMTAWTVGGAPMMKIQMLLYTIMIPLLIVIVLCASRPGPCFFSRSCWSRSGCEVPHQMNHLTETTA